MSYYVKRRDERAAAEKLKRCWFVVLAGDSAHILHLDAAQHLVPSTLPPANPCSEICRLTAAWPSGRRSSPEPDGAACGGCENLIKLKNPPPPPSPLAQILYLPYEYPSYYWRLILAL